MSRPYALHRAAPRGFLPSPGSCIGGCSYGRPVSRPPAYRVPFRLEHDNAAYRLINVSAEVVHGVSLTLHGRGVMAVSPPRVVRPGYGIEVDVPRSRPADAILVVRWLRPTGVEYVWRLPV